jgi:RNA-binding motif protein, X-linked 2
MNTIRGINNLNASELTQGITGASSWHADYAKSAYIFFGNLNYGINEGDIVIVFSQFGEIVDCRLVRDKI